MIADQRGQIGWSPEGDDAAELSFVLEEAELMVVGHFAVRGEAGHGDGNLAAALDEAYRVAGVGDDELGAVDACEQLGGGEIGSRRARKAKRGRAGLYEDAVGGAEGRDGFEEPVKRINGHAHSDDNLHQ